MHVCTHVCIQARTCITCGCKGRLMTLQYFFHKNNSGLLNRKWQIGKWKCFWTTLWVEKSPGNMKKKNLPFTGCRMDATKVLTPMVNFASHIVISQGKLMYVCVCMYVCVYVHIVHIYEWRYDYVCLYVCACMCVCVWRYECTVCYECMYVCMYFFYFISFKHAPLHCVILHAVVVYIYLFFILY